MSELIIGIDMAIFMIVIGCVIVRCTSKICDKLDTVAVGLSVIIDELREDQEESE